MTGKKLEPEYMDKMSAIAKEEHEKMAGKDRNRLEVKLKNARFLYKGMKPVMSNPSSISYFFDLDSKQLKQTYGFTEEDEVELLMPTTLMCNQIVGISFGCGIKEFLPMGTCTSFRTGLMVQLDKATPYHQGILAGLFDEFTELIFENSHLPHSIRGVINL